MRSHFAALLLATSLVPVAAFAAASDSNPSLRVSTGVVAPRILNSSDLSVSSEALQIAPGVRLPVIVKLKVNEAGSAEDVQILKSINPKVDQQVLAAVKDFRFRPATLDAQPIAVNLRLTVFVAR